MSNGEKIYIVIPCYNEQRCVCQTIATLWKFLPEVQVVAVNDGSCDKTLEFLQSIKDERLTVLNLPFNSGIGTAVQTGLLYALRHGADYAVKFDADGQHPADQLENLLSLLRQNEADLVIGSRFLKKTAGFQSSFMRRLGIQLFRALSWLLTGVAITDATSGYRAYNRRGLCFAANYYPSFDYPEPEECILFLRNGYRVREISCSMHKRQAGKSSISILKSLYFMPKVSFAMIMERIRAKKQDFEI